MFLNCGGIFLKKYRIKTRKLMAFFKNNILKADDSVHRIALGVAIGIFVAWIPLPGALMLTVIGLTILFRANTIAGIAAVWINNPLTIVPMYYTGYLLGRKILTILHLWVKPDALQGRELYQQVYSFSEITKAFFKSEYRQQLGPWILDVGKELWTGCLVIGLLSGFIGYVLTFNGIQLYRQRAGG